MKRCDIAGKAPYVYHNPCLDAFSSLEQVSMLHFIECVGTMDCGAWTVCQAEIQDCLFTIFKDVLWLWPSPANAPLCTGPRKSLGFIDTVARPWLNNDVIVHVEQVCIGTPPNVWCATTRAIRTAQEKQNTRESRLGLRLRSSWQL